MGEQFDGCKQRQVEVECRKVRVAAGSVVYEARHDAGCEQCVREGVKAVKSIGDWSWASIQQAFAVVFLCKAWRPLCSEN